MKITLRRTVAGLDIKHHLIGLKHSCQTYWYNSRLTNLVVKRACLKLIVSLRLPLKSSVCNQVFSHLILLHFLTKYWSWYENNAIIDINMDICSVLKIFQGNARKLIGLQVHKHILFSIFVPNIVNRFN